VTALFSKHSFRHILQCRALVCGIFYKWKAKFGGVMMSEAKPLKILEDENTKLMKLLAE
jgi:hypothetical protein